jgi:succinate-semialdehyde dehydrogenase/glutarate-semialdehyde dehydrogenase
MAIASINPATGETLRTFDPLGEATIEEKLALASAAFASIATLRLRIGRSECARSRLCLKRNVKL